MLLIAIGELGGEGTQSPSDTTGLWEVMSLLQSAAVLHRHPACCISLQVLSPCISEAMNSRHCRFHVRF